MVERRWAWPAIIAFGPHTQSNDVGCGMTSPHLGSTHGQTTLGVTCHHRLWTTHTVERRRRGMLSCLWRAHTIKRRRAWYDITAFGQHTWSNNVGRDMPSPPLDSTYNQMTSGVACHHPLWAAHTVELRRTWHAIISIGKHKW